MARPGSTVRLLLSALLLGASFPTRAEEADVPGSAPTAPPLTPAEQIKNACDSDAVAVRLLDPSKPDKPGKAGAAKPGPAANREKDAQSTANRLGSGVEGEADESGQTLSWKRGKTTKGDCRAKLQRLSRDFPDRVSFEPTTAERVEKLRQSRDAIFTRNLRENPADASIAGGLFDGGLFKGLFGSKPGEVIAATPAPGASPYGDIQPVGYAPTSQLPSNFRGITYAPPPPVSYEEPSFTRRVANSVTGAYEATTAYVSSSIDDAGKWVSGVARSVRNRFYSGIEMIQGFGYKFIHAGRQTNWGTKPLVDGLRNIAAYMRGTGKAETDLAVGDLSSANGGQLGGHASHQTGRDVDIGFYMTDAGSGKAVDALGFVRFTGGRDGLTGNNGGRSVRFDAERNWMLVQAILANPDPAFKPTNIFIANHLKAAVLAAGAKSPERGRAAALMSYWPGHDNHLHLRVQ